MRESIKAICVLLMAVGAVTAAIAWSENRPDSTTWWLRIGTSLATVTALGVFLAIHFRRDLVHDYLGDIAGNYYNRDGFCFLLTMSSNDGIAYMNAFFQNQRDASCWGRIAVRPARGFWMGRAKFETITFNIDCAPAAFGVARIAIPVPNQLQGKRQGFEVGASVMHLNGKGRQVRFRDGLLLRTDSDFDNNFGTALTIAGTASGMIVLTSPAKVMIQIPAGVSEDVSDGLPPVVNTLWKLGDPPLAQAQVAV